MDKLNMSDLQISLIIIGVIVIAGVAIFNWLQQLHYRRKIQAAFNYEHDDILLDQTNIDDINQRIEPKLNKSILNDIPTDLAEQFTSHETHSSDYTNTSTVNFDSTSNYIVTIKPDTAIPITLINPLLHRKFDYGKPLYWLGQKQEDESWEEITTNNAQANNSYICLQGCLQLADRAGPISEVELSRFRDMSQDFASQNSATIDCPDIVATHEQAVILDKFCAEVDVMIGINIISKDDGAFVGTKIRALAEASGFKLESDGLFKYRDDNGQLLFTLANYESAPFLPDNIKTLTTHGVTFLLDVPRIAKGEKVFDQMTHLAKIFSNTLGGIIVDDNRVPLSDNGLSRSKQQLIDIQTNMRNNKIDAGSQCALRLFV